MGNQFSKAHLPQVASAPAGGEQAYIDLITAAGPLATRNITHSPETFDGATDYEIGNGATSNAIETAQKASFEAVVSVDSLATDGTVIGTWGALDAERQFLIWYDAGNTRFQMVMFSNGNNTISLADTVSSPTLLAGSEYHVVGVWDRSASPQFALYVNGTLTRTESNGSLVKLDITSNYHVGSNGLDQFLTGTGRGFAIYNRALSAAEVAAHHTAAFDFDVAGDNPAGQASRSFDGVDDYIDTNSETIAGGLFAEAGNPFSVSCWVKNDTTLVGTVIGRAVATTGNRAFQLYVSATNDYWAIYSRGEVTSFPAAGAPPVGEWIHAVVVYDGASTLTLYENNVSLGTATIGTALESASAGESILIGARTGGAYFFWDGNIADVRFYNRALSSGEVQDLYNGENITNGLDAHYLGNEDNVNDLTGNGNDATNVGSTFVVDDGPFPDFPNDGIRRSNLFVDPIQTSGIQTVSQSSSASGRLACRAFLYDPSNWVSATNSEWSTNSGLPEWIKIDFGETIPNTIKTVYAAGGTYSPVDFLIQSSPDDATWTTRKSIVGQSIQYIMTTYTLDTPSNDRYWRVYVTSSVLGGTRASFRHLSFFS